MSGKNYNGPYEDELDRMRARRRRTAQPQRRQRFDDIDDYDDAYNDDFGNDFDDEFDDDFEIEDLDDFDDEFRSGNRRNSRTAGSRHSARGTYGNGRSGSHDYGNSGSGYKNSSHGYGSGGSGYGNSSRGYADRGYGSRSHAPAGTGRKKKRKVPVIFLLLVCLLLLSAGTLYAKRWMKDRDGYWNIAVFGVDSRDGGLEKGALADVQMIASINKKTGEIRLVSVYRDTYVQINNDGDFHKINEAYFKGGHKQALDTLKRNLDIDVDDYATFNWKAVADAINILGGVDLEITDSEFAYINSFITATVESTGIGSFQLEHPGMNHLDGVQAVAYSRLRLMDTDYNRTERQRKVVSLALEKAKQADFNTLKGLAGVMLSEISTSVGLEDVLPLVKNVNRYYLGQTGGFPFAKTTALVGKLDCVIPMTLESNVVFLHQFLFDQDSYTPSASVKKISGIISERTGIYEEGKSAGADTNLTGTTGNSGQSSPGSSGNSSGTDNNSFGGQEAPVAGPEEPPVTEEVTAEETEEETKEESEEETEEPTEEPTNSEATKEKENETQEEKTTAKEHESEPAHVEPLAPEETTLSQEQIMEGPGSVNPPDAPADTPAKPTEPAEQEIGPGFE